MKNIFLYSVLALWSGSLKRFLVYEEIYRFEIREYYQKVDASGGMMPSQTVYIRSAMNGMAITMHCKSIKKKGGKLSVTTLKDQPNQTFQISKIAEGRCAIKNVAWSKVLDVINEKEKVYAEIIGYELHGGPNQLWIFEPVGDKHFYILNVKSNLVVEIEGGIDAEGMRLVQNKKYCNLNQLWELKPT